MDNSENKLKQKGWQKIPCADSDENLERKMQRAKVQENGSNKIPQLVCPEGSPEKFEWEK